jgi:AraC-like DNA-binding protein
MSKGQFFRAFKVSVGLPPLQYIARRRIERAREMMNTTTEPLSQIAIACGLYDQSHFCRIFRRIVGQSPGQWQRANARDPYVHLPNVGHSERLAHSTSKTL